MYIGIDLGGTNIAVGLVDESGKIIAKDSTPTVSSRNYNEILKDMVTLSEKVVKDAGFSREDIKAVGIGFPGSVDQKNGFVVYGNNLNFNNVPLCTEFRKHWDVPVVLENDANAAAYGEYIACGEDAKVFMAITLGTGVGGGIIIDNKIFTGSNGAGAELGHATLVYNGAPCTCGKKGCWESYASVTALINQTKIAIEKHPESLMAKLAKERGKVNGRTSFDAAKMNDAVALQVVDTYLKYVADGLVSMVNIFQPDKVVIGGGISNEGEYILGPIRKYVEKYDYNKLFKRVEIDTAKLLNDAGIIGAAFVAKNA